MLEKVIPIIIIPTPIWAIKLFIVFINFNEIENYLEKVRKMDIPHLDIEDVRS